MIELKNKNVIVTGGSDGIGKATCIAYAKAGANVVVSGYSEEKVYKVVNEITAEGGNAVGFPCDVTNETEVEQLFEKAIEEYGSIDVVANVAGVCELDTVEEMSLKAWNKTIDTNLTGVFLCCKSAVQAMKEQGYGKIINMASQAGKVGMANLSHYCASKAGVIMFTRALALEAAEYGITVNSVCPGNVDTDMMEREAVTVFERTGKPKEEVIKEWTDCIPLGRYASAEEIADLMLFLASSYSDYITGEDVNITGGMTMH